MATVASLAARAASLAAGGKLEEAAGVQQEYMQTLAIQAQAWWARKGHILTPEQAIRGWLMAMQKQRDLVEVEQGLDLLKNPLVSQEEQKLVKRVSSKAKAKAQA